MPGKGPTTTSKQESNPWAPTVDAMKSQIGQLGQVATKDAFTPQYSSATMQGIGMLENVAGQKGVGDAAAGYVQNNFGNAQGGVDTLTAASRGDNLNGNPYLQKALDSQYGNIQNRIAEQFSGGGRLGSGMQQKVTTEALAKAANDASLQNYNTERGYQMNAAGSLANMGQSMAGLSGQMDQNRLFGAKTMLAAGEMRDQQQEAQRQAALNAYDYQNKTLMGFGGMGGSSSGTHQTQQGRNTAGMILGGLMMAGGAATGNPMMAAQGAGQMGRSW